MKGETLKIGMNIKEYSVHLYGLTRNDPILKLRKCFKTLKMKKKTFSAI